MSSENKNQGWIDARFTRSYLPLAFIAGLVLGGDTQVEQTVQNCWNNASRTSTQAEGESAFRKRLLGVLVDECLTVLDEQSRTQSQVSEGQVEHIEKHNNEKNI